MKIITTDNGSEFAPHQLITKKLGVLIYFTDPYCSWQKGAVENGNKLTRQYIPQEASIGDYSKEELKTNSIYIESQFEEKIKL